MGEPEEILRLLLVEDSDDDAELIRYRLVKGGLRFALNRAQNEREVRAALREAPDLVISDYSLPGFGALAVLDILREVTPALPLLIVSGAVGEESAAHAMRCGAVDYLLKDRLARLPQAVTQAIGNARMKLSLEQKRRNLGAALADMERLSQQLVETQERERKSLARELHDELGQRLTSLNLILYRLQPHLQGESATQIWRQAECELSALFSQVREMSVSLRPPVLDHFGLEAAIRSLVDRQVNNAGMACTLEFAGVPQAPGSVVEITAYRVVQESLTNVMRHAQATRVVVEVNGGEAGDELEIVVRDNGRGFDTQAWKSRPLGRAMSSGLFGMRERVELLGGRFQIDSKAGAGTRVVACLPVENKQR